MKVTQDMRGYAKARAAQEAGMQEMSAKFRDGGGQVYVADKNTLEIPFVRERDYNMPKRPKAFAFDLPTTTTSIANGVSPSGRRRRYHGAARLVQYALRARIQEQSLPSPDS